MIIAVCDDKNGELVNTRNILRKINPKDRVITFDKGFDLIDYLAKANSVDCVILDMLMPTLNGLATAKELRLIRPNLAIIVLTDHANYALPCYEFFPVNFLLKPIKIEQLKANLDRVRLRSSEENLFIQTERTAVYVQLSHIINIERQGIPIIVHLVDGTQYVTYQSLNEYEKILTGKGFYRINRKDIINLQYVRYVNKNSLIFENDLQLPVSQRRKSELEDELSCWRLQYA